MLKARGESATVAVGLLRQETYDRSVLKEKIDLLWRTLALPAVRSRRVLLKPNLIAAKRRDGLPCTHGEFIAAVAGYLLDNGAQVAVGDSPAFGRARGVMKAVGIADALAGLPVTLVDFQAGVDHQLASGVRVRVARAALECDLLVNLPKCKAHCQLLVSLAVKNYFGAVLGWRKPWLHMRHGEREEEFAAILVDLLALFPATVSLLDGIIALHRDGPINGEPVQLGVLAASANAVAMDTAMLQVLGVDLEQSLLWRECRRRNLAGADPAGIVYPLLDPVAARVTGFKVPARLRPVSFHPRRLAVGAVRRLYASVFAR